VIRYIKTVPSRSARGVVQEVYRQIKGEFGTLGEPLTLHSPLPALLAGLWCSFRESLVAGVARRDLKEAVAVGVSRLNQCPYCIDAHSVLLRATQAHEAAAMIQGGKEDEIGDPGLRAAAAWAKATRSPGDGILDSPPFSYLEAPEMIGTAVWIHYINRMSKIFLGGNLIPLKSNALGLRTLAERMGGLFFARFVQRAHRPGDSLHILPEAKLPRDLAWASASPAISHAFAAFACAVEEAGSQALEAEVRECVKRRVDAWDGAEPGLGRSWTEPAVADLRKDRQPAARLALLAALTPYLVDQDVVGDFQSRHPGDEKLLGAIAWSSFTAARRIGSWLKLPSEH
jgi:AhpD family alkylhydroperoxidase